MGVENSEMAQQKEIQYYAALVNAWIVSKMEIDRLLVTLSSGGLVVLVTLLSLANLSHWNCGTIVIFSLLLIAGVTFIITIISCILIYSSNADYIEKCVHGKAGEKDNRSLSNYDCLARATFFIGVTFMSVAAVFIFLEKPKMERSQVMSMDNKCQGSCEADGGILQESFTGLNKLSPESGNQASLTGINNLQPSCSPNAPASSTNNNPPQQTQGPNDSD